MVYKLTWKHEAEQEFGRLDDSTKKLAITQFKKLSKSPQLGALLGKKAGL